MALRDEVAKFGTGAKQNPAAVARDGVGNLSAPKFSPWEVQPLACTEPWRFAMKDLAVSTATAASRQ